MFVVVIDALIVQPVYRGAAPVPIRIYLKAAAFLPANRVRGQLKLSIQQKQILGIMDIAMTYISDILDVTLNDCRNGLSRLKKSWKGRGII
jgi:hypothetical protein